MTIYGGNFQFFLSRISFKLPIVLMVYKDEKRFAEVIFKGCKFLKEIVAPRRWEVLQYQLSLQCKAYQGSSWGPWLH